MSIRDFVYSSFNKYFQYNPSFMAKAPGRVNLLGEYVDFNNGFVLPVAIDQATYIAFSLSSNEKDVSTIYSLDFNQKVIFSCNSITYRHDILGNELPQWALYPAGIFWALKKSGFTPLPINAVYASNVPNGAGLSSSASVEIAFAIAWAAVGNWNFNPMQNALIAQNAENHYVGVNCGIMDQFASACGIKDNILFLDCQNLEWKGLSIPKDISIVIANTNTHRSLTDSQYNIRRSECDLGVNLLSRVIPGIKTLRDVSIDTFETYKSLLPEVVQKRVKHVVEETERTRKALKSLHTNNIDEFGDLMKQCHHSLKDLFEVSTSQLDNMVEIAEKLPGYVGARLTGAGFGGCTVNLVHSEASEEFGNALADQYVKATGIVPSIYYTKASDGARILD